MAKIDELIKNISDPKLREDISREVATLKKKTKFGLVFEEHLPEQVLLPGLSIQPGARVVKRGAENETFTVVATDGGKRTSNRVRIAREIDGMEEMASSTELVVVKRFGEPIYPALVPVDRVIRAPGKPYHTVINAENFHALQLFLYCYEGQVDVIYIDPPYNTGARDWKYNNNYVDKTDQFRHSKWLSMMKKRLRLAKRLLKPTGILIVTIDDYEVHLLKTLIAHEIGGLNILGTVVIKTSPSGRPTLKGFRGNHEYAIFVTTSSEAKIGTLPKSDKQLALYAEQDEEGRFDWVNLRKRGGANTRREARPRQFYPLYILGESVRVPKMQWDKTRRTWNVLENPKDEELVLLPIGDDGKERIWSLGYETLLQNMQDLRVIRDKNDQVRVQRKLRLDTEGSQPSTLWDKNRYSIVEHGTVLLERILGSSLAFPFPKSIYAVQDCLRVEGADNENALILDFFAGSGTTLHSTCLLNAEDGGNRQCILVTNNEVNEKQAIELRTNGYWPGDDKFEEHGIAESVTWPRCKYVVKGERANGTKLSGSYLDGRLLSDGFEENIEYFKMDFIDPADVEYGDKFEAIVPIVWLMAGAKGDLDSERGSIGGGRWFIPKESPYAVLIQEEYFAEFKRELKKRPDITHVFLITDSEAAYREMIGELPGSPKTKMLYRSYLDNFRINMEPNL
jgi:adenine-specific DNA-methyltransferase